MEHLDHSHFPEPPKEPPKFFAPDCADQLPVIAHVGRGLRGDSFRVVVAEDDQAETYLEGLSYDAATKTWTSEWMSENINGGQLMYQYNLRPHTNPQTFTITFRYKRPNRSKSEWVWTTPAIPYIWDADNDGLADIDEIVGTGIASLFLKKTTEASWVMADLPTSHTMDEAVNRQEKLLYPEDWSRDHFNAPVPGEPWTVNLQYGVGGDIDAPNVDDLAKVLGITINQIRSIIAGETGQIDGSDNIKDYIDDRDQAVKDYSDAGDNAVLDHIHGDLGFGDVLVNDGDNDTQSPKRNTVRKWIDWIIGKLGFGDLIDSFGSTGAGSVKGYIDALDAAVNKRVDDIHFEVENPSLYIKEIPCTLVLYELPHNQPAGVIGIPSHISSGGAKATAPGIISISYFDVLPTVTVDVEVNDDSAYIALPTGDMVIACNAVSGGYDPINLANVVLEHRNAGEGVNLKAPVLNPETLSQSGYSSTSGNWQIFTGVGNVRTKTAVEDPAINGGWPWFSYENPFYLYLFNRSVGEVGATVRVDNARAYFTRYDMATKA